MRIHAPARPLDLGRLDPARLGIRVVPVNGGMWRITTPDGTMIGHVQLDEQPDATRYVAKRYSMRERAFRLLGEFRTGAAAVEALRYG